MRKFLLILFGVVLLLSLIPINFAQSTAPDSDKDGIIDTRDDCDNQPGPISNNGCPLPDDNGSTYNPDDTDGDGNPNYADQCPNEGGPASNAGCPETTQPCPEGFTMSGNTCVSTVQSSPEPALPQLPEEARCRLATFGRERVNVRNIPDLAGEVVGQLDPFAVYEVHFHIFGENAEDEWYLVDLGWVSGTVVRLGGYCRNIPGMRFPQTSLLQIGRLGFVFVGDGAFEPETIELPNIDTEDEQIPDEQLPPFLLQACDGSVRISWILQDFRFCDGSVMPTDQMPNAEGGSAFECDGQLGFFDSLPGETEVSLEGILIGLLLPAVKMGDGSVMPINEFLGDGSVLPCPTTNLMAARASGGGGGTGKVSFQDFHFMSYMDDGSQYGIIIIGMPDEGEAGDPFIPYSLDFGALPPDPDSNMQWVQINGILIGLNQGDVYLCPALGGMAESSMMPSSGAEEVGFNPQPDPPRECMLLQFEPEL